MVLEFRFLGVWRSRIKWFTSWSGHGKGKRHWGPTVPCKGTFPWSEDLQLGSDSFHHFPRAPHGDRAFNTWAFGWHSTFKPQRIPNAAMCWEAAFWVHSWIKILNATESELINTLQFLTTWQDHLREERLILVIEVSVSEIQCLDGFLGFAFSIVATALLPARV